MTSDGFMTLFQWPTSDSAQCALLMGATIPRLPLPLFPSSAKVELNPKHGGACASQTSQNV